MSYLLGVKGNPLVTKEEYEIARENGISPRTVVYRMQKGYTKEQAITTPSYKRLPKRSHRRV
jgi:DNA-binding CsgD family transcriptional regulator